MIAAATTAVILVVSCLGSVGAPASPVARVSSSRAPWSEKDGGFDTSNHLHVGRPWPPSSTSTTPSPSPPTFRLATNTTTSLVTSAGQTAYLHCLVLNLGDRSVSWIRRSDLKILTIGPVVYTRDKRFSPIHRRHVAAAEDVWILKVTDARVEDSGEYECQVAHHGDMEDEMAMIFSVQVLDSRARIHEGLSDDLYLEKGSRLSLSCSVSDPSAPPTYVYWYRDRQVLNYSPAVTIREWRQRHQQRRRGGEEETHHAVVDDEDDDDGGEQSAKAPALFEAADLALEIKVGMTASSSSSSSESGAPSSSLEFSSSGPPIVSTLSIDNVNGLHSGNYTCAPSNARAAAIMVHVVDDDSGPAAMHTGGTACSSPLHLLIGITAALALAMATRGGTIPQT